MTREIGPREKALREQREADFEANQKRMREQSRPTKIAGLHSAGATATYTKAAAVARQKRGKPRKPKGT